jgi:hypothetical protein
MRRNDVDASAIIEHAAHGEIAGPPYEVLHFANGVARPILLNAVWIEDPCIISARLWLAEYCVARRCHGVPDYRMRAYRAVKIPCMSELCAHGREPRP